MIYIIFGLPGVGKTYVGNVFQKHFDFYFFDGDIDMSEDMHAAVRDKLSFSDDMRSRFFHKLLKSTKDLAQRHSHLVIAQTFIKEKYRKLFLREFPNAQFIFVKADDKVRENRLIERRAYPLDLEYTRQMIKNFDRPTISHATIDNSVNGEEHIEKQLQKLFK